MFPPDAQFTIIVNESERVVMVIHMLHVPYYMARGWDTVKVPFSDYQLACEKAKQLARKFGHTYRVKGYEP